MFKDRVEAGERLAEKLKKYKEVKNLLVLAIPRGGVVIGGVLRKFLGCPLNVLLVKKIGAPQNPELAIGAVGPDGTVVWNKELLQELGLSPEKMAGRVEELRREVKRRDKTYKSNKTNRNWKKKTVILTDDGVATGATVEAALLYLAAKQQRGREAKIILAVPVIAADTLKRLRPLADEVIYLEAPEVFWAVGQFYREFPQVSDEEVIKILNSKSK